MMTLIQFKHYPGWAALCLLSLWLAFSSTVSAADLPTSNSRLIKHEDSSGGKSTDTIALSAPRTAIPDGSCYSFVDADIVYRKQRFGEAKITSKPARGCNPERQQCLATISIGYAPVGRLHYRVKSKWDVKSSGC